MQNGKQNLFYKSPLFWLFSVLLILTFGVYFSSLPTTVQNLDSGELVTNAHFLQLVHPPGYPLFTYLYYVATNILPTGEVFWRASFFTTILSVLALILLYLSARTSLLSILSVFVLALSGIFWKYSVLPDVFILHGFALCLLFFASSQDNQSDLKVTLLSSLALFIGVSNHHTFIFTVPIFIYLYFYRLPRKYLWHPLAAGAASFLLYTTLFLINHEGDLSYRSLSSWDDFFFHFFRRDYGTFQLAHTARDNTFFANTWVYLKYFFKNYYSLLALGVYVFFMHIDWKNIPKKVIAFFAAFILYIIIFYNLNNIVPSGFNLLLVERFFLTPTLFFVFLLFSMVSRGQFKNKEVYLLAPLLVINLVSNFLVNQNDNNFKDNKVVEDYVLHFFQSTKDRPALVIFNSDTKYFAARYVQKVLGKGEGITILSMASVFSEKSLKRLSKLEGFKVPKEEDFKRDYGIFKHLVRPNIEEFDFYFAKDINLKELGLQFNSLGRKVTTFAQTSFDVDIYDQFVFRTKNMDQFKGKKYREELDLYKEYAFFPLKQGLSTPNPILVMDSFETAVKRVPYCIPAQRNICLITPTKSCRSTLDEMKKSYYPYF